MNLYDMFAQDDTWSTLLLTCSYLSVAATIPLASTLLLSVSSLFG